MYKNLDTTDVIFCGIVIALTIVYFIMTNTLSISNAVFIVAIVTILLICFANVLILFNSFIQIEDTISDINRSIVRMTELLNDEK